MNRSAAGRLIGFHVAAIAALGIFAASVMTNPNRAQSMDVADPGTSITAQHTGGHQ